MSKRNVSLNALRVLEAASRYLSFTRAAAELHITQAAVSQQIRGLEDQLGVPLFTRDSRTLRLTAAGQELSVTARSAINNIQESIDKITGSSAVNVLTVSTLPSLASRWLIPRLPGFQERHSDIELHIHTSGMTVDLLASNIDAAIRLAAVDAVGLRREYLMSDALCLVCAPALATAIGDNTEKIYQYSMAVDSTQLSDFQSRGDLTGLATELSFDMMHLDKSRLKFTVFNQSDNVVLSALGGQVTAMTRLSLCIDDIEAGRLQILFEHSRELEHGFSLVYPQFRSSNANLQVFRKWLVEEADAFNHRIARYTAIKLTEKNTLRTV